MIKTSVNFVLLLLDDFTGTKISDAGTLFTINGRLIQPIKKPEGYCVFTGIEETVIEVLIKPLKYKPQTVQLDLKKLTQTVTSIRFYRQENLYFSDSEWIRGAIKCKNTCVFVTADDYPSLKLQAISDDGMQITILGLSPKTLVNCNLSIGANKMLEIFNLNEKLSANSYSLQHKFLHPHKQGELITRAFTAISDAQGGYSIPVTPSNISRISPVHYYNGEAHKWES